MPDYTKGKIYKLQCDDGHYYIGSTCDTLRNRFYRHKNDSHSSNSKLYNHINQMSWDKVRIVLVEEFPCENKEQLVRKEDEHIRSNQHDDLCLNTKGSASASPDVRAEQCRQKTKRYTDSHKEQRKEYMRDYYQKKKLSKESNEAHPAGQDES